MGNTLLLRILQHHHHHHRRRRRVLPPAIWPAEVGFPVCTRTFVGAFLSSFTLSLSLSLYLAVVLDSRESKAGRTPHVVYISYCQVKRRCDTSRRAVYKSTKLIFGGVLRAPCFVPRASCHIAPTPPPHLDPIPFIPSVVTHEKSAGVWLILKIRSRQGPCGAAAYVRHVITEPYSPRP